jgi:hypothetical protein
MIAAPFARGLRRIVGGDGLNSDGWPDPVSGHGSCVVSGRHSIVEFVGYDLAVNEFYDAGLSAG